jgi:phage anti-repressor protein
MTNNDSIFIKLLKKHTNIDIKFINTFFKKFKIGGELDFEIKDSLVSNYLNITLDNIRRRLQNKYSKTKKFIENVDFIKIKDGKTTALTYMINYQCFEKIAMSSETQQSETVRLYFIKLREFIVENQKLIFQAIENKNDLSIYRGYDSIYFFAVDDRKPNIFKVGRTQDIVQRLRNYNVGRIKEIDLKYFTLVKNPLLIEKCIGFKLEKEKVFPDREIFLVNPKKLKKIIDDCYCKYVSKQQNEELYKEISDLLGLYAYTKDKINIKPYIIIKE